MKHCACNLKDSDTAMDEYHSSANHSATRPHNIQPTSLFTHLALNDKLEVTSHGYGERPTTQLPRSRSTTHPGAHCQTHKPRGVDAYDGNVAVHFWSFCSC